MSSANGGSFPYANTQDNLFTSIVDNDRLVSKYRLAPPDLTKLSLAYTSDENKQPSLSVESKIDEADDQQKHQNQRLGQKSTINLPKYRICIDSVDKVAESSMLKSAFIVYRIRFSRVSDLQSHATWKRFKEMSSWYMEV